MPTTAAPFGVGGDPAKPDFRVRDLDPYPGLDGLRLERRRTFLQTLEGFRREAEEGSPAGAAVDPAFEQAYRLASSAEAKRAFRLEEEPPAVRDRYGRRTLGQACLLARRLVERGVNFVTVNDRGWDTHQDLTLRLKEGYTGARVGVGLVPTLDQALSGCSTTCRTVGYSIRRSILVAGEFGRTPKVNAAGGRDHWPRAFSVANGGGWGARGYRHRRQ